ncbi:MAG: methyltransferase domain-containing protein [Actinomycetia bacterium]|nr:methyltransferase domain-containing protein [Actinomycetes bacterium]
MISRVVRAVREYADFARQAVAEYHAIGAVAPSGPQLAVAMTAQVDPQGPPVRVLEVGAGTGPVTRELLLRLPCGSQLVVVEPSRGFTKRLRALADARPEIKTTVLACRLDEVEPSRHRFHHIVSSLPFAIFHPDQVRQTVEQMLNQLVDGGTLSYFAYRGAQLRIAITPRGPSRDQQEAVQTYLRQVHHQHHGTTRSAWVNLPPAVVRTIRT